MLDITTFFDELLPRVEDTGIRDLTREVLRRAPRWFWCRPASSSGKYHPAFALGEGGLLRHTLAVFRAAEHLLQAEGDAFTPTQRSLVLAGALLHDVCKWDDEGKHTVFVHPLRAARLVHEAAADTGADANDAAALAAVVASHMGRFNVSAYDRGVVLPLPTSPEQKLLYYADYLASRKDVAFARPPHVWPGELCEVQAGACGIVDDAGHELPVPVQEPVRGVCSSVVYDEGRGAVMVRVVFACGAARAGGACRAWNVPAVFVAGTGEEVCR